MCGRFTLDIDERFYPRFRLSNVIADLVPRFNISPNQFAPVIIREDNDNKLIMMKWGLIPKWTNKEINKYSLINAKIETLNEKPVYSTLINTNRCIVPISGFYEWKEENELKQPYYFTLKNSDYLSLAGLYSIWEDKDNNKIKSFAIITKEADEQIKDIHNRMPLILNIDDEDKWLSKDFNHINNSYINELEIYRVSRIVNNPKNDNRELINRITP